MELTPEQITFIRKDITTRGITMEGLADSLADHICCAIEQSREKDFQKAYSNALARFGPKGLEQVQKETLYLLIFKREVTMKKTMFILGYVAAFLISSGLLFKIQHWNGATIILSLGVILLNVGFLPIFFYDRYKKAIS